jgi:membrane protease subunit (stomatin/prohibitin family)
MGFLSKQLLKVIEYVNTSHDKIIYKFPMDDRAEIMNGSSLTVREGQVAVFMKDGRIADVFAPGRHVLNTANLPILTTLMSWAKGFNSPFKCDVYFVETTQFAGQKWGTTNPFTMRDRDFGMIRVRGYGKYAFKVVDAKLFMQTFAGSKKEFTTDMISEHLRGIILSELTDIIASSGLAAIDLAGSLMKLNDVGAKELKDNFESIGLAITSFVVENLSFPEEVERAIDKSSSLGILGGQMGNYTKMAQADALREAAKNPGMAGTMFGMGVMGGLGQQMYGSAAMAQQNTPPTEQKNVPKKFCPECGGAIYKLEAKFCPDCGKPLPPVNVCPKCGKELKEGAKFCSHCGHKCD